MVAIRIASNDVVVISIELLPTIRYSKLQSTFLIDIISIAGKISAIRGYGIRILVSRHVSR
jgi:hypothetical protein